MAPTPRISTDAVARSAVAIADAQGFDALSVSAVAGDLSVAPSALYTYCDGLDGLRNLVAVTATETLTSRLRDAAIGNNGNTALDAMGTAYRTFALQHPGQFASTLRPPPVDNDDFQDADQSLLNVFVLVYAAMGLDKQHSHLAARTTRSALHGFLALEHTTGTSAEHAAEYRHLIDALQRGLAQPTQHAAV